MEVIRVVSEPPHFSALNVFFYSVNSLIFALFFEFYDLLLFSKLFSFFLINFI